VEQVVEAPHVLKYCRSPIHARKRDIPGFADRVFKLAGNVFHFLGVLAVRILPEMLVDGVHHCFQAVYDVIPPVRPADDAIVEGVAGMGGSSWCGPVIDRRHAKILPAGLDKG
jgi:hypothetical protein